MRARTTTACLFLVGIVACRPDDDSSTTRVQRDEAADGSAAVSAPGAAADVVVLDGEALAARLTEVETALRKLPGLIGSVRQDMRRNLNATHVAAAERHGVGPVRDDDHLAALLRAGDLVELPDSSTWWVVRDLTRSHSYVTPVTQRALEEIGRRFHTRLAERGLPPFRFEITSALRTGVQQQELRRRNRNASATTSSHEFGTTFDIAYLKFAAPRTEPQLDSLATSYAPHLEGELGFVLQAMQREGMLLTLRERSQPVFHTTITSFRPAER